MTDLDSGPDATPSGGSVREIRARANLRDETAILAGAAAAILFVRQALRRFGSFRCGRLAIESFARFFLPNQAALTFRPMVALAIHQGWRQAIIRPRVRALETRTDPRHLVRFTA